MFQAVLKYFKNIVNSDHISVWKSKELSNGSIKLSTASNNGLAPKLNYINSKIPMTFDGTC